MVHETPADGRNGESDPEQHCDHGSNASRRADNTARHDQNDREDISLRNDQSRGVKRNDHESEDHEQEREPRQQPVAEPLPRAGEVPL